MRCNGSIKMNKSTSVKTGVKQVVQKLGRNAVFVSTCRVISSPTPITSPTRIFDDSFDSTFE